MAKRFALVAFKFPPFPQVGARRWTKLTKYLARMGWEIEVFTTDWGPSTVGMDDVRSPNITIHRIPCPGLHRLWIAEFDRSTLRGKTGWFVERVLTRFVRHWRIAEEARYWRGVVPALVNGIDEGRFDTVVATGGPFWAFRWAAKVKRQRPSTRLVIDYRDPWSNAPAVARDEHKATAQRTHELAVLDAADEVVTVTRGLAELLLELKPTPRPCVIRNGCDLEELPPRNSSPRPLTVLYSGNLAGGRERTLEQLLRVISLGPGQFRDFRFEFYGHFPGHLAREFGSLLESGTVVVHGRIPPTELMVRVRDAFACLQVNSDEAPFALSTKLFEYACVGRPILCLNYGGEIDDLMRKHDLGWSVRGDSEEEIREALRRIESLWRSDPTYSLPADCSAAFSYASASEQWSAVLGADRLRESDESQPAV